MVILFDFISVVIMTILGIYILVFSTRILEGKSTS